jgi:beta-phosphoglucomutase
MLLYYGKNKIGKEAYMRDFVGITVLKNIEILFPDFSSNEQKNAEERYKHEFENRLDQIQIKEHSLDVLELVKKKNLKCGLVTNTPRRIVTKILTKFGIIGYFQAIVCEGEAVRAKPFPDPVLKGCELLSVNPDETILVEDSVTGVTAGKAAGCYTVAVRAVNGKKLLEDTGADIVLDDIGQLSSILVDA